VLLTLAYGNSEERRKIKAEQDQTGINLCVGCTQLFIAAVA